MKINESKFGRTPQIHTTEKKKKKKQVNFKLCGFSIFIHQIIWITDFNIPN